MYVGRRGASLLPMLQVAPHYSEIAGCGQTGTAPALCAARANTLRLPSMVPYLLESALAKPAGQLRGQAAIAGDFGWSTSLTR